MSFNPLMALLSAEAVRRLEANPTVVELGNQRFRPSNRVLREVVRRLAGVEGIDHAALAALVALPERERLDRTADFYRALGFTRYVAIDVNEKFGSVMMDLNKDLAADYGYSERFSLVTNNGTGEHVFNQYMVFKNVHELCRPNGLMVHSVPFINWVNHGFYSFHPGLYSDLAAANGYGIELIGFADRAGKGVVGEPRGGGGDQRKQILYDELRIPLQEVLAKSDFRMLSLSRGIGALVAAAIERRRSSGRKRQASLVLTRALARSLRRAPARKLLVFAMLRKRSDAAFRTPFQGIYSEDIGDAAIKADYSEPGRARG